MIDTEDNNTSGFWFWLAIAIFVISVSSFYILEQNLLIRIILLLAGVVLSAFVVIKSKEGKKVYSFILETKIELKKVIWPTRPETIKTTITVMIVVFIISLFLWLIDSILLWIVQSII